MELHRLVDDASNLLGGFDEVGIGVVGVSGCCAVAPMLAQLAERGKRFARHDRVARSGVPQVEQAQPAELCVFADHPPAGVEIVRRPPPRVLREQEGVGVAGTGQRLDNGLRRFSKLDAARARL